MNAPQSQADFQKVLVDGVGRFGQVSARNFKNMFGVQIQEGTATLGTPGIDESGRMFVSILFTGTIYGEYIFALEETTASKILGHQLQGKSPAELQALREDIGQTFSEILNITVGECIQNLGSTYDKLTITAPRVLWGHLAYPRVHNSRMKLMSEHGAIEVFLYVDRMKLDVASSYQEALQSLGVAHQELQNAMRTLQNQQCVLVQTEKMASLGVMAAGLAHEINTPLATISLVSEQIKETLEVPAQQTASQMLDVIERTVQHISKITHGLRLFSRGGQNEPTAVHSFNEVVKNSLVLCKTYLEDKQIKLTQNEIPASLTCECRPSQLAQVILNLVRNSADAIEKLSDKWINLDVRDDADWIELRMTDAGSGIPADKRSKIFDPFYTTKDVGKGTGLGLSISKGLIDDHGGDLFIDEKSPNTCFVMRIPKKQKKTVAA
jgi:C4-dicarboxylate-specific signal transduction histidine kinase